MPEPEVTTFVSPYLTVELTAEGLLLCPSPLDAQLIWWEELRRIEWPEHGRVRLVLLDGHLDFDQSFGDLHAFVAAIELAARAARAAWDDRPVGGLKLRRWFGLEPVPARAYSARGATQPRRRATVKPCSDAQGCGCVALIALGIACVELPMLGLLGDRWGLVATVAVVLVAVLGVVRLASRGEASDAPERPTGWPARAKAVEVKDRGLSLDGQFCPWAEVRAVRTGPAERRGWLCVTLSLGRQKCSFDVPGGAREAWAFDLLEEVTRRRLEVDHDEPPPDNALSLTRLGPEHAAAERGLSQVERADA